MPEYPPLPEPAWKAEKALLDSLDDGLGPYMEQSLLSATRASLPPEWSSFKSWAEDHLGQGYSLACAEGALLDSTTAWCFKGWRMGIAAERQRIEREVVKLIPYYVGHSDRRVFDGIIRAIRGEVSP